MTPTLYAQPYDISATGFYFESVDDYTAKAAANVKEDGQPVEEYEIQFIDGDGIDCALAKAFGINQSNIAAYFTAADTWDDHEKRVVIIAVDQAGYDVNPNTVSPNDFDIDIYELDSLSDLATQFVDEGLFGDIPDRIAPYLDMEAIASDLSYDYAQTTIAGTRLVYRAG